MLRYLLTFFKLKSAVAGIVGIDGGIRVVVTPRWRMKYHVGPGERLFVIPGLRVCEPVSWGEIPALINRVNAHIRDMV